MTIQSTPLLEEAKILALLREQGHPSVADWKVKVGEDSFDYPAVWAWGILEAFQEFEQRDAIRKQVRERISHAGDDLWVYDDSAPKRNRTTWMPWSARKPLRTPGRRQHEPCCRPAAAGKRPSRSGPTQTKASQSEAGSLYRLLFPIFSAC